MILQVYLDEQTLGTLRRVAVETGRTVEDLAESAVAEAALQSRLDHYRLDRKRA